MDDISPEEKVAIATKFLLSSPPGEFDVVLRDVKEILGSDASLLADRAEGIFRAYHHAQLTPLTHTSASDTPSSAVLSSALLEFAPRVTLDPRTCSCHDVDHVNGSLGPARTEDSASARFAATKEDPRVASLATAFDAYAGNHLSASAALGPGSTCATFHDASPDPDAVLAAMSLRGMGSSCEPAGSQKIEAERSEDAASRASRAGPCVVVHLAATRTSPRNFWSGRWRSTWILPTSSSSSSSSSDADDMASLLGGSGNGTKVTVFGSMKVQGHYYEEGNVQLTGGKCVAVEIDVSGGAAAVVAAIAEAESEYQNGIDEVYLNMKAFQSLRRKLPIHGEKFNWDNIAHSRLAGELNK